MGVAYVQRNAQGVLRELVPALEIVAHGHLHAVFELLGGDELPHFCIGQQFHND